MATKITSGSIFSAGAVVVGVDASAPPAVPSPAPEPAPETTNIANSAVVTVSSEHDSNYPGSHAVDGVAGIHNSGEWATAGETNGAWIQLDWATDQLVNSVRLWDRTNTTDNILSGTLSFSDGSTVSVGPVSSSGLLVEFDFKTVYWVRFTVDTAEGLNIGLSEIEVSGAPASSPAPAPEPYNYFTASSVSDWYMFGSSTVSEPTDGTFRFTRIAGNGNVGQYTVTGLTGGASYVISATGDTSQNDYVAEFSLQNANWQDEDGAGPLESGEGGTLDWAAGATNDTQSVTFTMPEGETSVIVRVRLGYTQNYPSNTAVWDFSNIKVNDA